MSYLITKERFKDAYNILDAYGYACNINFIDSRYNSSLTYIIYCGILKLNELSDEDKMYCLKLFKLMIFMKVPLYKLSKSRYIPPLLNIIIRCTPNEVLNMLYYYKDSLKKLFNNYSIYSQPINIALREFSNCLEEEKFLYEKLYYTFLSPDYIRFVDINRRCTIEGVSGEDCNKSLFELAIYEGLEDKAIELLKIFGSELILGEKENIILRIVQNNMLMLFNILLDEQRETVIRGIFHLEKLSYSEGYGYCSALSIACENSFGRFAVKLLDLFDEVFLMDESKSDTKEYPNKSTVIKCLKTEDCNKSPFDFLISGFKNELPENIEICEELELEIDVGIGLGEYLALKMLGLYKESCTSDFKKSYKMVIDSNYKQLFKEMSKYDEIIFQ